MFDSQEIEIPCENCKRKTSKTVRWLKANKRFTCRCGTVVNVDSSHLLGELKKVERSLGKLFK